MYRALCAEASHADVTPGQIVRNALAAELRRRHKAKTARRADEQLVAPLRALLARDLADGRDWSDIDTRLKRKGYQLRESGGGLALYSWPDGARVCKASELGFSYTRLMRRIGTPFPNHSHRLVPGTTTGRPDKPDDPFDVIEPFSA